MISLILLTFIYFIHMISSIISLIQSITLIILQLSMLKLGSLSLFVALATSVYAEQEAHSSDQTMLDTTQIWGFGFLAGFGVSCIGFVAALVLVFVKKCCNIECFQIVIKFFFSLSCGALVGDAIVHIMAQAFHNEKNDAKIVSLIFILSMFFFMVLDRILHSCGITHSHWVGQKCQGDTQNHGHHHHQLSQHNHSHKVKNDGQEQINQDLKKIPHLNLSNSQSRIKDQSQNKQKKEEKQVEEQKEKNCCENLKGKGSIGYLNLIGSLIHNFIDGLALGLAFAVGKKATFVPVLVAIIAHEIPRELGDVAILLKSNFSEVQTILCNGFVNFVSLIGLFIGLGVATIDEVAKSYVLVFVAGNFIYIASDIWQHILKNKGEGSKIRNTIQFFGLAVGIGVMFLLTLMQNEDHAHQ